MSEQQNFKNIPIVSVSSGAKYKTTSGIVAIKDGIKTKSQNPEQIINKKPAWLKIKLAVMGEEQEKYQAVKQIVQERSLSTVCEEAKCPNISECWSHGTATIMLLGSVCTRACKFCSVDTGNPHGWLDLDEPEKAAQSAELMGLKYIVLTSVDRDDLPDGGADHYAKAIRLIKKRVRDIKVEALTPDFQGNFAHVQIILDSGVDVFAQNLETVERLTKQVRDIRASYQQTLDVLAYAKRAKSSVLTKSSLMLGLGEEEYEVQAALRDLRTAQVDIVTLGQYLQPTPNHLPVMKYIPPADFARYREFGLQLGFLEVAAGPMVRSSYRADRVFAKNNLDL